MALRVTITLVPTCYLLHSRFICILRRLHVSDIGEQALVRRARQRAKEVPVRRASSQRHLGVVAVQADMLSFAQPVLWLGATARLKLCAHAGQPRRKMSPCCICTTKAAQTFHVTDVHTRKRTAVSRRRTFVDRSWICLASQQYVPFSPPNSETSCGQLAWSSA